MNKRTGKRFISDAFAALALSLSVLTSSGAQADTLADALVGAYRSQWITGAKSCVAAGS